MRARLFLFQGKEEFKSTILPAELNSLEKFLNNWNLEKSYLHIGFSAPDSLEVENNLSNLPFGLYSSRAFMDSSPGSEWNFSGQLGEGPSKLGTHFVFASPLHQGKEVDESTKEIISCMENDFSEGLGNEEVIERENINILEDVDWTVRTFNVLQSNNIVFLSDLVEWSEEDLIMLPNFGRKSLAEIEDFLDEQALELKKKNKKSSVILWKGFKGKKSKIVFKKVMDEVVERDDINLLELDWSVRTLNVLKGSNINLMSKLINYSEKELIQLPNFGKTSLTEVLKFLDQEKLKLRGVDKKQKVAFTGLVKREEKNFELGSKFFDDIFIEMETIENSRNKEVLIARFGFYGEETLESVGEKFDVTRERIRQIEKKALSWLLRRKENKLVSWYKEIVDLEANYPLPLQLNKIPDVDDRFSGSENVTHVIHSLIEAVQRFAAFPLDDPLKLTWFEDIENPGKKQKYLCYVDELEISNISRIIKDTLKTFENIPLRDAKLHLEELMLEKQTKFFNYFWDRALSRCLIEENEYGDKILIKFSGKSMITLGVEYIVNWLENNKVAVRREKFQELLKEADINISINSIFNVLLDDTRVFTYKHGLWAAFKNIEFNENDRDLLVSIGNSFIIDNKSNQFHSQQVIDRIRDKFNMVTNLSEFEVTAILKRYGDFFYIGRNIFSGSEKAAGERILIHDSIVGVLEEAGRPLHHSDIMREVSKYRYVDKKMQIQEKQPIIKVGRNIFGLDYWDIEAT